MKYNKKQNSKKLLNISWDLKKDIASEVDGEEQAMAKICLQRERKKLN